MASPATATAAASVSPSTPNQRPPLAGDDAPWRAAVPRVHHAPVPRIRPRRHEASESSKGGSGGGGGRRAGVCRAGQPPPLRRLGHKVWPIDMELRFLEAFGRALHSMRKFMDKSCSVMDSHLPNKMANR